VVRGTLTLTMRRVALPGLSGGTDLARGRGTSRRLLRESRER
jgi:hypothetical protein